LVPEQRPAKIETKMFGSESDGGARGVTWGGKKGNMKSAMTDLKKKQVRGGRDLVTLKVGALDLQRS